MSAPDGFALAEQLKDTLLSYLTSALPVGNHRAQAELGRAFYERWSEDLFSGPYVESLPIYEKASSLDEMFGDTRDRNSPDFKFGVLMNNGVTWADVDHRFPQFRRVRDRIWPPQSDVAEEEEKETTTSRIWHRQLYKHQQDSFNQLIQQRRNLVVATATGSGKTECFLLPLLYSLLTEPEIVRRTAGVRALLVYPMNALVEDQMHRLRQILFWINLSCHGLRRPTAERLARPITFGRYTGNTPISLTDRDPERQPSEEAMEHLGEIVYRSEMQQSPPDILVTNFTMLEYILLRGDDQKLFQQPNSFQFLILDEIHTYAGTQGMEVALLLRRLRAFLEVQAGRSINFRVVGTSATLPSGVDARHKAARFASTLFGAAFEADDVLRPEPAPPPPAPGITHERQREIAEGLANLPSCCLTLSAYLGLTDAGAPGEIAEEDWKFLAYLLKPSPVTEEAPDAEMAVWERLASVLDGADIVSLLRHELAAAENGCLSLEELADRLFGDHSNRQRSTTILLRLIGFAHRQGEPLISMRFHHFVNEPASAQICLRSLCKEPLNDGWWSRLFVRHRSTCSSCGSFVYPVLLCRRCGFVYLQGWRRRSASGGWGSDLLPEPDDADDQGRYRRVLFRPLRSGIQVSVQDVGERKTLCLACGRWMVARDDPNFPVVAEHACPAEAFLDVVSFQPLLQNEVLEECLFCDQRWFEGQDVVTPPATSVYGTATVLIEELARGLETAGVRPFESKLISFSDSRQQAAQLAFRFQKTNREFTFRQLVWRVVSDSSEGITTPSLLDELYRWTRDDSRLRRLVIDDENRLADRNLLRQMLATLLFREAVSAYLTLEAQGLVRLQYDNSLLNQGRELNVGDRLLFDRLSPETKQNFMLFLLDWAMRFRFAIDAPQGGSDIDWQRLLPWSVVQKSVVRMRAEAIRGELSFVIAQANPRNRSYNFCKRLFARLHAAGSHLQYELPNFQQMLGGIFDCFLVPGSVLLSDRRCSQAPLMNFGQDDPERARLKVNFDALRWRSVSDDDKIYKCDACGRISYYSIGGICPLPDCSGTLQEITARNLDEERFAPVRHYRRLIRNRAIRPLRVEEHTAQVANRKRQLIENDFRRTTEDGVDVVCGSTTFELGIDLGTIHAVFMSNLPPRVANYRQRAGRAGRRPGMVPFILNYVRQRPHDQYFWAKLRDFISGPLPVPHLAITSQEVQERHGFALLVSALLEDYRQTTSERMPLEGPGAGRFVSHALSAHAREYLRQLMNDNTARLVRQFQIAFADVPGTDSPHAFAQRFFNRLEDLRGTYLPMREKDGAITVLSDYGILPSYAFPLYVDELRLNKIPRDQPPRCDLKLQRDRRIALREYMPGRAIVAGKAVIRSEGLWAGYDERRFSLCTNRDCHRLDFSGNAAEVCPYCGATRGTHTAVIPRAGFFGDRVDSIAEQDYELAREKGETYFDPANDPPPNYIRNGAALETAVIGARIMEQSGNRPRMRQFNPRPGSASTLLLIDRPENDLAMPHLPPVRCLARPRDADRQRARAILLMHEFTTDILRLKTVDNEIGRLLVSSSPFVALLRENPDALRRSFYFDCLRRTLAEALVGAGCLLLDIDNSELDVAFLPGPSLSVGKEIILFDTAPGGAGYSRQLAERLREAYLKAEQLLASCSCGDSCYGCLRTYHNQIFHKRLNRHLLLEGLQAFNAGNWI